MATRNGSRALGHETGELSVGKVADVILINLQNHHFTPWVPGNKTHLTVAPGLQHRERRGRHHHR